MAVGSLRIPLLVAVLAANVTSQVQLPDGPGKEEAVRLCKGCHELEKSFSVRKDRTGWEETMTKMISLGAKGAPAEFEAILEYLVRHFPADEIPPLNVNQARAIDLESRLSIPRSQAAAIIRHRDANGPFKTIGDLKKVPGVDAARIEAKKDRLVFK
jgi:competence protein ComEA